MMYILITILLFISFAIFIGLKRNYWGYKKVKPLSKMTKKEFKRAMKDLEIK